MCAKNRGLSSRDEAHLILAALLHDIGTPPFGHTLEYVLTGYDHEFESNRLLADIPSGDFMPPAPVFGDQLPKFGFECKSLSKQLGIRIDPLEVARIVTGESELGFLVKGTIDLDNADNVVRASRYMGLDIDPSVPLELAEWLAKCPSVPMDYRESTKSCVRKWIGYRDSLYRTFFYSSDEELGRQAFLQHIMRRALRSGIDPIALVWSTDEGCLETIHRRREQQEESAGLPLRQLVDRYRLLETALKVAEVQLYEEDEVSAFSSPDAVNWLDGKLTSSSIELFPMFAKRRFRESDSTGDLLPPAKGVLTFYKLGAGVKRNQLPEEIVEKIPPHLSEKELRESLSHALTQCCAKWQEEKPWLKAVSIQCSSVEERLNYISNWDFRLSRNDNLHAYPATYVHAIPRALINALGMQGQLVADPFCGTGQTGVESLRLGGDAILSDNCSVACLISQARFTYLAKQTRAELLALDQFDIDAYEPADAPSDPLLERWYHKKTIDQLCRLKKYVSLQRRPEENLFLRMCFSSILQSCTGRRGKQHGFFADNTPLAAGESAPPYHDAYKLFVERTRQNVASMELLYARLEREGRDPEAELARVRVIRAPIQEAGQDAYSVEPNSVGGIVTSPPYLCMADYTLGQRLSYQWLFNERLESEYETEMGSRRERTNSAEALRRYYDLVSIFADKCSILVVNRGYVAVVLGVPVAKAFASEDILGRFDSIMLEKGLELIWNTWRNIHWHRQHGYSRLKKERIAVYQLKKW